ncbi:amyotrophic lateral sclerosis 2 chromosomal region candidate gene 12 protein-like isoform X2 [Mizuhopecten yessoensis]|uniref:Amyotrophic lateral sclerosis 2 chromosomal region candidate gene 12-like protein n=1 Tax=Mizuhopecten yessoensis TaxID=6573 RepID=A0A210Q7A7_MIZYE|nr:amyotrophic lateral sclerosis 2 chromosomal region candidate gene 12 protein-like isoform X2 [Mizuhopecten yessoensis]OWF44605.1 Amyotrophic lateral sclerosis 2 chromosomal region candidate gene 12-like protein [Mizuhopecten yessoensis]
MSADVLGYPARPASRVGMYHSDALNRPATHSSSDSSHVKRPRSTPGTMRVSFQNGAGSPARMHRPKTAASTLSVSPRSECDRVFQVEREPTRRHNLESHIPHKRSAKAPPWMKNVEPPMVPCVVAPGYLLSRSKSKFAVTIKDEFFDPVIDESQKKQANNERESLVGQLQQQISDLSLYLEEERLNHRQTKQKAEDFLKDKVEEMTNHHKDNIRELQEDQQEEMEKLTNTLSVEHNQYKITTEAQITKMKKEIEFLQGAFESYKSSLHDEMNEKWNKREQDLNVELEEQKLNSLHEFKAKMMQEKNSERISSGKEHARNLDSLRKEHKKELDAVIRRFSNVAADLERLKKTTAELKEIKSEMEQVKTAYDSTCQQMANTTRELADARVKLMSYEEQFEDKVSSVDEKYKKKIHDLMRQNIELRRLYVEKCEELYNEKVHSEATRVKRVSSAKEVMHSMIKSKHKANVSLSPAVQPSSETQPNQSKPDRPGSAPITRVETDSAQQFAGKFEDILRLEAEEDAILSPSVILPEDSEEVVRMRKELMKDIMEKAKEVKEEEDNADKEQEEEDEKENDDGDDDF